ncbi:HU family DNA-binding protein [Phytomonospora endophytica]|uniref:HU family DNA-binding protein n=1 Tax=Phytomonospora endophytica TaxID=714109 RepID=UPI00162123AF|nr:HU family DNA-binding protein [Phytomonospora endophytica]GIG69123.1 hypothetical protein Pen01_54180 [Phytomonospora endophytica]
MNKAELVEVLTARLGDRKSAQAALDAVLEEIQRAVSKGDKVSVAGFGVFEKRARAARMARNPRTGEAVKVKKTSVPAFRPGQGFKDLVSGVTKPAPAAKSSSKSSAKTTTKKAAAKSTVKATKATAKKTAAKKSTAKKTAAKKTTAPATKAATRKTATKAAGAKKTVKAAAKTATKKATTTKAVAAKKGAKKAAKKK